MPKISVIMGIYNTKSKEYLEKSIKSILNQSYRDFEFIICNDGSTNECERWAREIINNDKRVKMIENKENKGLAYTLNHCLKFATGEYIARMDDDDYSHRDRFDKQIKYLEKYDVDLVSNNINLFDENGIYGEQVFPNHINKKDFLFNSPIVHPTIMAKKRCFDVVNGYRDIKNTIRVEDYDLFIRMFSNGIKMDVIQEKLYDYRADYANSVRRKKYKYRINEAWVRFHGFKSLNILYGNFRYVLKPLIIGLISTKVLKKMKNK